MSGGRAIKQWEPDRFAEVALRLIQSAGATIVLTGAPGDRRMVEHLAAALPADRCIDASSMDLLSVAALLARLDVLLAGDTGPMHLAGAVGTPVVAVFGPSDPARTPRARATGSWRYLRAGPIRRPRRSCWTTPDCLPWSSVRVYRVMDVLEESRVRAPVISAPLSSRLWRLGASTGQRSGPPARALVENLDAPLGGRRRGARLDQGAAACISRRTTAPPAVPVPRDRSGGSRTHLQNTGVLNLHRTIGARSADRT